MIVCVNCRKEIQDDTFMFCPHCGKMIPTDTELFKRLASADAKYVMLINSVFQLGKQAMEINPKLYHLTNKMIGQFMLTKDELVDAVGSRYVRALIPGTETEVQFDQGNRTLEFLERGMKSNWEPCIHHACYNEGDL